MKKGEYVRDVDVAITTVVLVVGIRWLSQDFGSMLRMVVCMYVRSFSVCYASSLLKNLDHSIGVANDSNWRKEARGIQDRCGGMF